MKLLLNGEVLLTKVEFDALPEYSTTLPTGTVPGKAWKRRMPWNASHVDATWWRGVYGNPYPADHKLHGEIPIDWRRIRIERTPARWPRDVRVPLRRIS